MLLDESVSPPVDVVTVVEDVATTALVVDAVTTGRTVELLLTAKDKE